MYLIFVDSTLSSDVLVCKWLKWPKMCYIYKYPTFIRCIIIPKDIIKYITVICTDNKNNAYDLAES